uniref:Uncharacterized protein n=1 Tax=Amphora coffeiformis TaxID=265554 RepID=A0A7S3LG08_9STRA|eukprot:scaffold45005_cov260-Amphora_coffeaeformis.AAC.2
MNLSLALPFLVAGAVHGFAPRIQQRPHHLATRTTALFNNGPVLGAGGMADTRDPDAMKHEDPRKSIAEAPSFEEYMKQRAGGGGAPAPAPAPAPPAAAPAYDYSSWGQPAAAVPAPAAAPAYDYSSWGQPAAAVPAPAAPAAPAYDYSSWGQPAAAVAGPAPAAPAPPAPAFVANAAPVAGGDPIATFKTSQQAVVDEIVRAIPDLERKPDFCWDAGQVGAAAATLEAFDAPGKANIAWLANLVVDSKLCSLTIFNGPLADVPHLLSRVAVVGDTLELSVDARPRAYGAYEMVDPQGNYPGPEELGRKAFEYSGARMDFFNKYGTDVVKELLNPAQFENATPLEALSDLEGVTAGPLALNVRMPVTDANIQAVARVRDTMAQLWLDWSLNAEQHRPGAPVNTQYVYDTKFRQNCFGALLPVYKKMFGPEDGAMVAVAESGPLDEAYVGGGS